MLALIYEKKFRMALQSFIILWKKNKHIWRLNEQNWTQMKTQMGLSYQANSSDPRKLPSLGDSNKI